MDKHASSSHSHPKTPTHAMSTSKGPSPASAELAQNVWIKDSEESILDSIANWTRAPLCTSQFPGKVASYSAVEGTEKDIPYNLGLIYEQYGPLSLRYEGCDGLARHWVAGWDTNSISGPVWKVMICVVMKKRLPGQSPVFDRLSPSIKSGSDSEEENEKRYLEDSIDDSDADVMRNSANLSLSLGNQSEIDPEWNGKKRSIMVESESYSDGENIEKKDQDTTDWVNVSSGGMDDDEWLLRPNDVPSLMKDAGDLLLDGFKALRKL
ncbi:MAG: hypothetical protein ASARMPRED_003613 [Alectoria sarmentosa]|nr:MAG: hypothetical protein ASARMPRED_003613 [Alectoria sarmentosa]